MTKYNYYVYILASSKNGTLYIGVTNDLMRRLYEHKNKLIKGFTSKYKIHNLVYFEETDNIAEAIRREKQLKGWNRKWKIALIEKDNPSWDDLSKGWFWRLDPRIKSEDDRKNISSSPEDDNVKNPYRFYA